MLSMGIFWVGLHHREGDTNINAIPSYGTRSGDVLYQLDEEENFEGTTLDNCFLRELVALSPTVFSRLQWSKIS